MRDWSGESGKPSVAARSIEGIDPRYQLLAMAIMRGTTDWHAPDARYELLGNLCREITAALYPGNDEAMRNRERAQEVAAALWHAFIVRMDRLDPNRSPFVHMDEWLEPEWREELLQDVLPRMADNRDYDPAEDRP
jgi:hypothetical protein